MNKNSTTKFSAFISHSFLFGITIILNRVGALILVFSLLQVLSLDDFAVIALGQVVTIFATPIFTFGIFDAVQRMYWEWDESDRAHYIGTLWLFSLGLGLLLFSLLYSSSFWWGAVFFSQAAFLVHLDSVIAITFFSTWATIPLAIIRAKQEVARFAFVLIGMVLSQIIFVSIFVFIMNRGLAGYFYGMLCSAGLWGGYFLYFLITQSKFNFCFHHLKSALAYSFPTVPASILEATSSVIDRFILEKLVSLSSLGSFSLGAQFASLITSFNQILKSSWLPLVYQTVSNENDQNARGMIGSLGTVYVSLMSAVVIVTFALGKMFTSLVGRDQYESVVIFFFGFVIVNYISSLGTALGRGIDISKRMWFANLIPIVMISISTVTMFYFVPEFGVVGALYSCLCSMACKVIAQIVIACRLYHRPIYFGKLFAVIGIMSLSSYLIYSVQIEQIWIELFAVFSVAVAAFVGIFFIGFDRMMRSEIKNLIIYRLF